MFCPMGGGGLKSGAIWERGQDGTHCIRPGEMDHAAFTAAGCEGRRDDRLQSAGGRDQLSNVRSVPLGSIPACPAAADDVVV